MSSTLLPFIRAQQFDCILVRSFTWKLGRIMWYAMEAIVIEYAREFNLVVGRFKGSRFKGSKVHNS